FPVPFFLDILTNLQVGPLHKATIEKHGKDWTKPGNIVGNGAYVMTEWTPNSKVVLTKSPNYWDADNVKIEKVTYTAVEGQDAELKMWESGEIDATHELPAGQYKRLAQQYPKETLLADNLGIRYYSLNNKDPLFKDVRMRKALNMVIDRDVMAEKVTADDQKPIYSIVTRGVSGADTAQPDWVQWPMEKRVEEAKKLMAEAGVKPGTKMKFAYNTSEYHKKMAIFAQSEWKTKLGLETEMEAMEFKVLIKKREDMDYQIARNGWLADYNDASTFLTLLECNSAQNYHGYCNKEAQKLIDEGNQSTDPARRKELLSQANKLMMEDYPVIPLLQYTRTRMVKSWVQGFSSDNVMDRYRTKDLSLAAH
ncbi:MAG: peptide ABC transporter substrate-binding protein, partial [Brachymonas sp.]|nr:peptide ABC transporter substrate-binding protein [Brachymonas sp.]